ncbi:MAG: transglutaminase family protein [Vulcanimicrobiaceae bacterium]
MEYTIDHQTTYYYPDTVDESYTVVHLQPRSDQHQFCTRYALELSPKVRFHAYADRYGNDVQHFAILPRHASLSITAHSNVVTMRDRVPPEPTEATRALLASDAHLPRYYDYVHESEYVHFTPELAAFASELGPPGERIGVWCASVAHRINETFAYDTDATTVRTTVADALRAKAGVCQDFAHVMIAALRSARIPARYVSGYIFGGESRVLGAEASHAWCEAYLPPYGWVGFDPTNDRLINDYFVKVAIGRDYRDVSPIRGVYRGSKHSEMSVNVAMDVLAGMQQQQ